MLNDKYNGLTLDEAAQEAGGYVAYTPGKKFIMDYNYRELSDYCREKGVEPMDLPEDELKMFEINPPLIYPNPHIETMIHILPDDITTPAGILAVAESQNDYDHCEITKHND